MAVQGKIGRATFRFPHPVYCTVGVGFLDQGKHAGQFAIRFASFSEPLSLRVIMQVIFHTWEDFWTDTVYGLGRVVKQGCLPAPLSIASSCKLSSVPGRISEPIEP